MAYPNKSINEGGFGTFLAAAALAIYLRVKFVTPASPDGKPSINICGHTDRADAVVMAPIASGAYGPVRFLNSPGEQFGICSGTIAVGDLIYTVDGGLVSSAQASGALLCGRATCAGADGGTVTYVPIGAAA